MSARSRLRAAARGPLFAVVEAFWIGLFRMIGLVLRAPIERLTFSGHDRVLVVATHPDDEMMGCARAILAHRSACERVVVAAVTDGRRSRALGLPADEMAARRRGEFAAAMAELDAEPLWMGLGEGSWAVVEAQAQLVDAVKNVAPTLIYAPSIVDHHAEHRRVARALAGALASARTAAEVRAYQTDVPLTPLLANGVVVDEDARWAAILARAEARYATQSTAFGRAHRLAAQAGALWRTGAPAEVFWSMSADGYASAMTSASDSPFRGLRERPFGDGLAWLVGLRARRRLARGLARRQRRSMT